MRPPLSLSSLALESSLTLTHARRSDFWALGCILYQVLGGRPPFQARTEYLMFQKIVNLEYEFPLGFPADAKDLIEKLLVRLEPLGPPRLDVADPSPLPPRSQVVDPKARLGGDPANGNGIEAVMAHPFFTSHIPPRAPSPDEQRRRDRADSELSTPPSDSVASSLRNEPTSADESTSTPASSVLAASKRDDRYVINAGDSFAGLTLGTPVDTPPASNTPRAIDHTPHYPFGQPEEPLDAPIDWSTIWTIEPPQIHTGLTPPAPTMRGEFVLLGGDDTSSFAPSTMGTGLTGQQSWNGSVNEPASGPSSHEGGFAAPGPGRPYDEDEDGWEENGDDRGSISDDYAEPGSPTSTSGQDLPPASTFGGGKWGNVLLPSESILLCSPILQRPSAARQALLRSNRLKFPRSLLSTSSSSSASPGASPHNGTVPLPAPSPPINPSNGLLTSGAPSPPLVAGPSPHAGWKPRTLLLTDYPRLLCVKEAPDKLSVKAEVFLGAALRGGVRRDGVSAFIAVESRGNDGKEFVVRTVRPPLALSLISPSATRADSSLRRAQSARSLKFAEPHGQASRWMHELREAHRAGLMQQPPR